MEITHDYNYITQAGQALIARGYADKDFYSLRFNFIYQWAEDYFNDPDAKEDHQDDEKFVPRPYAPSARKPAKTTKAAKGKDKEPGKAPEKKPKAGKPKDGPAMEQISLL